MLAVHLLDGHVQHATRSHRTPEVRQHYRPVLRRHVLKRVDRDSGVELRDARQVLQAAPVKGDGQIALASLGQHPGGLVDADDPHASPGDQREIPAGPARRVEHRRTGRNKFEDPPDPLMLHVGGIVQVVIASRATS